MYEKMQGVPDFLAIYSRLINKRSIVIKTKPTKRGSLIEVRSISINN
jgi:hypothetical protein